MKSQRYVIRGSYNRAIKLFEMDTYPSPRVNGKLVLRSQPHYRLWTRDSGLYSSNPDQLLPENDATSTFRWDDLPYGVREGVTNKAYARFVGKINSGSASLGVTLASWKESRDMITSRLESIREIFQKVEKRIERKVQSGNGARRKRALKRRALREKGAGVILEGQFGWVPLLQDIHTACTTLWDVPSSPWIKASSRGVHRENYSNRTIVYDRNSSASLDLRVTYSAQVSISNQNLYLLNRAGLINPATVAWDLVPWSFVVNMFVNVDQMIRSTTDFVGLTLANTSTVRWVGGTHSFSYTGRGLYKGEFWGNTLTTDHKFASVSAPSPSLMWKSPSLDLGLASIASSLLIQQLGRVGRAFGAI